MAVVPGTTAMSSGTLSIVATETFGRIFCMLKSPRDGYAAVNRRGELPLGLKPSAGSRPAEWAVSGLPVPYERALAVMDERVAAIAAGAAPELVWLIEHPALYTAGTSAKPNELIEARFPVFAAGRGGQFTYHGPGQRVAYVMLELRRRAPDIRRFVATLEEWIIRALAAFGIRGERRENRIGVWVRRPDKGAGCEDKIAAIGIRIRHWISLHGIALNVDPDLAHFSGIVPCGVSNPRYGVTSLADLGRRVTLREVDSELRRQFEALFGATSLAQDANGPLTDPHAPPHPTAASGKTEAPFR
jgi:lipoyl(octanoyl) transferase